MLADVGGWESNKTRCIVPPSHPPPPSTQLSVSTTSSTTSMDKMIVQWSRTFKMDEILRKKKKSETPNNIGNVHDVRGVQQHTLVPRWLILA